MLTIGISFCFKEVTLNNGIKITLRIIDTTGQEKYMGLSKSYIKNCDAALFVFSLNNIESFENIRKWMKLFDENSSKNKYVKYLVGNNNSLDRIVDDFLIKNFVKETNLKYKSVDPFVNDGIDDLFQDVAESIFENYINKLDKEEKFKLLREFRSKSLMYLKIPNIYFKYINY